MNIAIIADDLTGANDTGVQLAKNGISTLVIFETDDRADYTHDAIVFDTDSRALSPKQAYEAVQSIAQYIKNQPTVSMIYKKIDSTLRGNMGAELDAIYDVLSPDFIVIAPSYPEAGRVVVNGCLYVNGIPLHESAMAKDPKNPMKESNISLLLQEQTEREHLQISLDLLRGDPSKLRSELRGAYDNKTPYLIFDAETDEDLKLIKQLFKDDNQRVIWCGSAGLAQSLSAAHATTELESLPLTSGPVLTVVGSVNPSSRRQLDILLAEDGVVGFELRPEAILQEETRGFEMARIYEAAVHSVLHAHKSVVIYTSQDVLTAQTIGEKLGLSMKQISDVMGYLLGELAKSIISACDIGHLVLTGGDTAKQVCLQLGEVAIELLAEVESGVPIGRTLGEKQYYVITKAGSFGTDHVLCHALHMMKGGVKT